MKISAAQVDQMTPWEFMACLDGYGRAKGWKAEPQGKPMSIERMRELGIEGV